VKDSEITGNFAANYGGGICKAGGDVATTKVTITGSKVIGNTALAGGGIRNSYGTTTMDNCEISGNTGKGIRNYNGMLEFYNPSDWHLQVFCNTPYDIQ
jgi:hypothetical protein